MTLYLWNDQLVNKDQIKVDIEDRGYQFGDGVYEVVKVYNGSLFTAKEHLTRLGQSMQKIGMETPFDLSNLHRLLEELVEKNGLQDGMIYLQVTRGTHARQHWFPPADTPVVVTGYTKEMPRPTSLMEKGVKAHVTADIRWLRCDIKSLNLLGNVLAKQEATKHDAFEAVLHREGTVTEGSSSNLYMVKDDVIYTHPATNLILNGITRQVLLAECKKAGLTVMEKSFTLDELRLADECFLTSTTSEVMPIVQIDNDLVSSGEVGPITRKCQSLFSSLIEQSCLV